MHFANKDWDFKLVEIGPLLAMQFHVLTDKVEDFCASLSAGPSVGDMLPLCLPTAYTVPTYSAQHNPTRGLLIEAADGNIRVFGDGLFEVQPNPALRIAGVAVMPPAPWVTVVHAGTRYYLNNGYHRVYGLSQRGVTHVPCIVTRAKRTEDIGLVEGGTFGHNLLVSSNPPTCGHFTGNRLYPIKVRRFRRFVSVNWAEYAVLDDGPEPSTPV